MSRTEKPRLYGGHTYHSNRPAWYKRNGNKWMRQDVRRRLKDILFGDAFDEKELPWRKVQLFDKWYSD